MTTNKRKLIYGHKNQKLMLSGILIYFLFPILISTFGYMGFDLSLIDKYNISVLLQYIIVALMLMDKMVLKKNMTVGENRLTNQMILFLGVYLILIIVSAMVHVENIPYLFEIIYVFIRSIFPLIIIFWYINDPNIILRYMRIPAYYHLLFTCVIAFSGLYLEKTNYMTMTYSSQVSWALITYFAFKERKIYDMFLSTVTSFAYIVHGARGGIIVMLVYYLQCIFVHMKKRNRIFLMSVLLNSSLIIILFSREIFGFINRNLSSIDEHGRTLNLVIEGKFFASDARIDLYIQLFEKIKLNPFGYGIGYDRVIGGSGAWYAHNILLELLINYGVVLGIIAIIVLLYVAFYMNVKCKNEEYRALFNIYFFTGFIMLQFSSSLYLEVHIFISLLVFLMHKNTKRHHLLNIYNVSNK